MPLLIITVSRILTLEFNTHRFETDYFASSIDLPSQVQLTSSWKGYARREMQRRREKSEFCQLVLFSIYEWPVRKSDMNRKLRNLSLNKFFRRNVVVSCNVIQIDVALIDAEIFRIFSHNKFIYPIYTTLIIFFMYFTNFSEVWYFCESIFLLIFHSISDELKMSKTK